MMKNLDLCKLRLRYTTLRAKQYAQQQMQQAQGCVKEHPMVYLAVALSAGFLLGKLFSRE